MKALKAWHFVAKNKRLGYGDGNIVVPGYVYEVDPPIRLCHWGLHASAKPLDALKFAPGPIVCRVKLSGEVIEDADKAVATRREVLWMVDATSTLHEFAYRVAEQALRDASVDDARCWAAITAKRKWLAGEITDQELAAARAAARDAAWAAARDAAWAAARAAAWAAARAAAWAAAWAAARAAARAAALAAARDAAWARQNRLLTKLLNELQP